METIISSAPSMNDLGMQQYIAILEKTNQQLSLWSNPYGVLVGALSFLVGFLAVGVAFILYRQSKEYRTLFQEALKEYEIALQGSLKKIGDEYRTRVDNLIKVKSKEIDTFSGDAKEQAKKIIEDLEKEKDSIGSRIELSSLENNQISPVTLSGSSLDKALTNNGIFGLNGGGTIRSGYCSQCGSYNSLNTSSLHMFPKFCSNCGNEL